uniref:Transcription termination and cleavage factor C-terminal domain-containing protein n=2 Tax=Lepeophtheirus salmonis TaxID=72036 RepID=A0A0K2T0H9_LEPSM
MGVPRDPRNRDPRSHASNPQTSNVNHSLPPHLRDADPDKTALIMQVFQLTDDQIASLPFEQRMSIMELKKQINSNNM